MRVSLKHSIIPCSLIVLLIGSVALAAGQAYSRENEKHIQLLSFPYEIASGQTVRTSMGLNVTFADGSVKSVRARIQLLDTEGEVIAESDEIKSGAGRDTILGCVSRPDPGGGRPRNRTYSGASQNTRHDKLVRRESRPPAFAGRAGSH